MCVKAGPPLMSPRAQTPGTLVSRRAFTLIWPRLSVSTPAASRLSLSVLGGLLAATSRCEPSSVRFPRRAQGQPDLPVLGPLGAPGLGLEQHLDAVLAHDLGHRLGHVGVLAAHQ